MKEHNLSEYVLQGADFLLFPITKDEIKTLMRDLHEFEKNINLPFCANVQSKYVLQEIVDSLDMDDDLWFLKSNWVVVGKKEKAIVGTLHICMYENEIKVFHNTEKTSTKENVKQLIQQFLEVNGYNNIKHIDE